MTQDRSPNPILAVLGRALEALLNRVLALDEESAQRIAALEGRAIAIEIRQPALALRLLVEGGRLRVGPAFEGDSQLRLSATVGSFLSMALRRDASSPLPAGKVEMSGDLELARRVEELLRKFHPDVEEAFSRVFGDVLGFQLAQAFKGAFDGVRDGARTLAQDGADYLREESRDLIAPAEMERFLDDVDDLRERGDRLQARVTRVQNSLDKIARDTTDR
jgi:ubiquinone biosynthesis accessory factor UbiJ